MTSKCFSKAMVKKFRAKVVRFGFNNDGGWETELKQRSFQRWTWTPLFFFGEVEREKEKGWKEREKTSRKKKKREKNLKQDLKKRIIYSSFSTKSHSFELLLWMNYRNLIDLLPRISEIFLEAMKRAAVFSKFNQKSAYILLQIREGDDDSKKSLLTPNSDIFEHEVMSFWTN